MDIRLGQKTAFVTGASQGIGRAIALKLARSGANLAIIARSEHELETLTAEIRVLGRQAMVVPCNPSDPSGLNAAVERTQRE